MLGEHVLIKGKLYLDFELSSHTTLSAKWTRSEIFVKIRTQNIKKQNLECCSLKGTELIIMEKVEKGREGSSACDRDLHIRAFLKGGSRSDFYFCFRGLI